MAKVKQGEVIFRQWDEGLVETSRQFKTLKQLFQLCIDPPEARLVDRVHIHGVDDQGNPRRLTLVFQSVTVTGVTD